MGSQTITPYSDVLALLLLPPEICALTLSSRLPPFRSRSLISTIDLMRSVISYYLKHTQASIGLTLIFTQHTATVFPL